MGEFGGTWGKLRSSVNRGVATVSVKAEATLEKTKIRAHIDSLEAEINKLLSESGRKAYDIWMSEARDFAALDPIFSKISEKTEEVASLRKELEKIPEKENQILGRDAAPDIQEEQPQFCFCSACGAKMSTKAKFCIKCGAKMN